MNDEELIRRVVEERPGAQEDFVRRYEGLVLGLAHSRFGLTDEAARELLQQVVERLWEHDRRALRSWRGKGRFSSYLTVIVCNLCLRQRQQAEQREKVLGDELSPAGEPTSSEPAAPSLLARRERRQAVQRALAELSPRDRLLLTLRFGDERTPKEIGALLRLRPGTVRKAVHDALGRLRRQVESLSPELFEGSEPKPRGDLRFQEGDGR